MIENFEEKINIELLKFSIKNAHKYYNFEIYAICVNAN